MAPKLEPGTYVLSQDVVNPTPDRRVKHDWRSLPVWKAGTVFAVGKFALTDSLEMYEQDAYHYRCFRDHAPEFGLLAPHLVPMNEAPSDYLKRSNWGTAAIDVLDRLAARGDITLEQVKTALQEWLET